AVDLRRELRERGAARSTRLLLGRVECLGDRRGAIARQTVVAYELIEVRANDRERRRPDELRLALRVVLLQRHQLGRRELVRRQLRAWRKLLDVEAAVELRRVDVAVPVVRAPGSADRVTCAIVRVCRVAWRVDRTAIEECDLRRMVGVGEVHDVDATLIPTLHIEVAPRYRDQASVVRDAVLLRGLRGRKLEVSVLRQLLVVRARGDDRVTAQLHDAAGLTHRARATAPLIGPESLLAIVAEPSGVATLEIV